VPQPPPGGQRPPYQPNVPCETQAPITSLDAKAGVPPNQMAADLSAPGAALRAQSALGALADTLRGLVKQQGLAMTVSHLLPSLDQLKQLRVK
jgi:hypothetical protein